MHITHDAALTVTTPWRTLSAPHADGVGPRPLCRADHDPGEQWPAPRREMEIRAHARERADSRTACAIFAVLSGYLGEIPEVVARSAAARCLWAEHGVGGPGGFAGACTARPAWAQRLGKGRKNARDGGAWDAALLDASALLAPEGLTAAQHTAALRGMGCPELLFATSFGLARVQSATTPAEAHGWAGFLAAIVVRAHLSIAEELGDVKFARDAEERTAALRRAIREAEAGVQVQALLHWWKSWDGPWIEVHPIVECGHGWTVIHLDHGTARIRGHHPRLGEVTGCQGWGLDVEPPVAAEVEIVRQGVYPPADDDGEE